MRFTLPRICTAEILRETYHLLMVIYCTFRLFMDRIRSIGDTRFTYLYGDHLDQLRRFRMQFIDYLNQDPARVELWRRRQLWIDYVPDLSVLATLPERSLGREYAKTMKELEEKGYLFLRDRRFQVLPEEVLGLNRDLLDRAEPSATLLRLLTHRRNIYMTSSHDFIHFVTGSNTLLAGESLVARYQYRHTLVPQNWLNMHLSLLAQVCLGRWRSLGKIFQLFEVLDRTPDIVGYDWEGSWRKPLVEVRRELGLPPEGLMPHGTFEIAATRPGAFPQEER